MHAVQKMLARAAGRESVEAGDIVNCRVDFLELNDLYLQVVRSFFEMGGKEVKAPDKVSFVFDHFSPAPTIRAAEIQKEMREFARSQHFTHHFDIQAGICHQVMPEAGIVYPGMVLVATDSHATTHGAFGAFGTGVGATDAATVLITGELWFKVPEVMKIEIEGRPEPGVFAKDVILHIIGTLKADAAVYQAIEFSGAYVDRLGVSERMAICNMAVEMGAKTAYMRPNDDVLSYVRARSSVDFVLDETDRGFVYSEEHRFDVTGLEPQLACPSNVDNVGGIDEVAGIKIDQAFVGSCTGGRLEDIAEVARVLDGRNIAETARLVVIPASKEVYERAIEAGYVRTLMKAGATLGAPGCGPCLGTHAGLLASGETCVTSTNRNFPGRMGANDAAIYLASPALVAASAAAGVLSDPRPYYRTGEQ
ncbi:MAG: 3-isopropylmalate dehydratase large subunit [Spirochaetota bacterium]